MLVHCLEQAYFRSFYSVPSPPPPSITSCNVWKPTLMLWSVLVGKQDVREVWRRSCPWCWPIYCQELSFISSVCGSVDTHLQSNIHHLQERPNDTFLPHCRSVYRSELYDWLQVPPKVRETAQIPLNIEPSCTHTRHICIDTKVHHVVLCCLWENIQEYFFC